MSTPPLDAGVLALDCPAEVSRIAAHIVASLRRFHKRGVVLGLSGGVDSSVCAALAVKALGPKKVFGLLMPERDSSNASEDLGRTVAEQLGISYLLENIGPTVEAIGCYRWRDEAMRAVFPDYAESWKSKIAIAGGAQGAINFFKLIVQSPDGAMHEARLPLHEYLQIVAATNYKQRIRKTVEYFHADRLNYAVIGTPNLLEYDQGFFVKNGDGAADIKPIAHLYKTQVYALARHLGLPEAVCKATPTTDTYSLAQGQDEFYFALPYDKMDLALWARNHDLPATELARALGIQPADAEFIYADIEAKRRTTQYLHARPALVEPAAFLEH
jgi:NAD+ synthase